MPGEIAAAITATSALRVYDNYDAIVDACCAAWTDLIVVPARLASITHRAWAYLS